MKSIFYILTSFDAPFLAIFYFIVKKYKLLPPDNTEYFEDYSYALNCLTDDEERYKEILEAW
mgnify:CR=1 FL=1